MRFLGREISGGGGGGSAPVRNKFSSPVPPVASAATDILTTSFTANWAASEDSVTYAIDVSIASDFSSFVTDYENRSVSGLSVSVIGLTTATPYYYRVRGVNIYGSSQSSNTITATTA